MMVVVLWEGHIVCHIDIHYSVCPVWQPRFLTALDSTAVAQTAVVYVAA